MDNHAAENAIRAIALGRKNWLFVGNGDGGYIAALFFSLAATCKDNKVMVERYSATPGNHTGFRD